MPPVPFAHPSSYAPDGDYFFNRKFHQNWSSSGQTHSQTHAHTHILSAYFFLPKHIVPYSNCLHSNQAHSKLVRVGCFPLSPIKPIRLHGSDSEQEGELLIVVVQFFPFFSSRIRFVTCDELVTVTKRLYSRSEYHDRKFRPSRQE